MLAQRQELHTISNRRITRTLSRFNLQPGTPTRHRTAASQYSAPAPRTTSPGNGVHPKLKVPTSALLLSPEVFPPVLVPKAAADVQRTPRRSTWRQTSFERGGLGQADRQGLRRAGRHRTRSTARKTRRGISTPTSTRLSGASTPRRRPPSLGSVASVEASVSASTIRESCRLPSPPRPSVGPGHRSLRNASVLVLRNREERLVGRRPTSRSHNQTRLRSRRREVR